MAPRVGLEPTAYRLTAGCSTVELPWNILEATPRFELGIKELQSTALPLGYVAAFLVIYPRLERGTP